ncbi:MAG TPA: hypothetical protein VKS79_20950 [Gemmataceae bacterium]|nr:hypothetical protein [Gemmataceae bacterium]
MAELRLKQSQTTGDRMPMVCMVCGEPAVKHYRKNFSWVPGWVHITIIAGLLPWAIIVSILTKRMWVDVPVCQQHRGYFWKRTAVAVLSFLLLAVVSIGAAVLLDEMGAKDAVGFVCVGSAGLFFAWVIALFVIQQTMLRPKEITDRSITLTRVHEGFLTALREFRDQEDDGDGLEEDSYRKRYRDAETRRERDHRTDIRAGRDADEPIDVDPVRDPDDRIQRGD